jgi:hypothetical protein
VYYYNHYNHIVIQHGEVDVVDITNYRKRYEMKEKLMEIFFEKVHDTAVSQKNYENNIT